MKTNTQRLFLALITLASAHAGCAGGGREGSGDGRADTIQVAGKTFSRVFEAQPLGATSPTRFKHSVQFLDDKNVVDNASTFFGNPPENGTYKVYRRVIVLTLHSVSGEYESTYELSADGKSINNDAGAVLELETAGSLAGKTFTRTFEAQPLGATRPTTVTHSVEFVDETSVIDNGSTFFGNPPEQGTYLVSGNRITLTLRSVSGEYENVYTLADDGQSISNDAGAVLTLESGGASLAGKAFSRTFEAQPLGATRPTTVTHTVEFVDATEVIDNGSTFFGNPPERGTYRVEGNRIILSLRSVTGEYENVYTLSADGRSISNDAGAVLNLQ